VGKLDGRVVFITGAARGQGRSHAVRLAQEGADIIAVDLGAQIDSVPYPLATPEDLEQTAREVEALGRRVFTQQADVRDAEALSAALESGVAELGPVDIVLANAGIIVMSPDPPQSAWQDTVDVNLTGVYNAVRVAVPAMVERKAGGAIVLTGSTASLAGIGGNTPGGLAYTASKHAVVGLMRAWANYLAPHHIRVNSVHPTGVNTPMVVNDVMERLLMADPSTANAFNALPVQLIEAIDVSNAIAWLVSDDARYVTGVALPVDAGYTNRR
jgi:SDR family mycofactocin-dependent oxidoreductase